MVARGDWVALRESGSGESDGPSGLLIRALLGSGETTWRELAAESLSAENVADGGGSGESGRARVVGATGVEATGVEGVGTSCETGLGGVIGGGGVVFS